MWLSQKYALICPKRVFIVKHLIGTNTDKNCFETKNESFSAILSFRCFEPFLPDSDKKNPQFSQKEAKNYHKHQNLLKQFEPQNKPHRTVRSFPGVLDRFHPNRQKYTFVSKSVYLRNKLRFVGKVLFGYKCHEKNTDKNCFEPQ